MEKILISACLLGAPVRYHGGSSRVDHARLQQWAGEGRLVPVCPEVEAGLPTPRPPAEIRRHDSPAGERLLVLTEQGRDMTEAYRAGARHALDLARQHGIRVAILKDRSPSCGSRAIYDGTFTGVRVPGEGVTAAALRAAGLRVFSDTEIDDAAEWLATVERA